MTAWQHSTRNQQQEMMYIFTLNPEYVIPKQIKPKYMLAHRDGSSLLKIGDSAATSRGERKMKTRAFERGRYSRDQYRLQATPKPSEPLNINSHFLHTHNSAQVHRFIF